MCVTKDGWEFIFFSVVNQQSQKNLFRSPVLSHCLWCCIPWIFFFFFSFFFFLICLLSWEVCYCSLACEGVSLKYWFIVRATVCLPFQASLLPRAWRAWQVVSSTAWPALFGALGPPARPVTGLGIWLVTVYTHVFFIILFLLSSLVL